MAKYKKPMKKRKAASASKVRKVALAGSPNAPYKKVPSAARKKSSSKRKY